jgi:hypothetical protein
MEIITNCPKNREDGLPWWMMSQKSSYHHILEDQRLFQALASISDQR